MFRAKNPSTPTAADSRSACAGRGLGGFEPRPDYIAGLRHWRGTRSSQFNRPQLFIETARLSTAALTHSDPQFGFWTSLMHNPCSTCIHICGKEICRLQWRVGVSQCPTIRLLARAAPKRGWSSTRHHPLLLAIYPKMVKPVQRRERLDRPSSRHGHGQVAGSSSVMSRPLSYTLRHGAGALNVSRYHRAQ